LDARATVLMSHCEAGRNCRRTYLLTGHAVKNLVPDELQQRTLESIRMCFLVVEVYASMRSVETNYS
jgi:hypothetical protein